MDEKDFFALLIENMKEMNSRLNDIEKTQAAHHVVLQDHTRRSLSNEEAIIVQREAVKTANKELITAIQPLQKHVTQVETVLKIIGISGAVIVTLLGIIAGVIELSKMV